METYLLRPRLPRVIALAALLVIVGGVGLGVALATKQVVWWVLGGIGAGLGLILILIGLLAFRRQRVWVELDEQGYSVYSPRGEFTGDWADVSRVAWSKGKDKIALYHGERRRTVIAHPAGVQDDELLRLRHAIDTHLGD
ncbi:MAG: hypothetical protein LBL55_07715 [Propionibacteriaceae bacterium]|jgi:hypothetical protein|nr:hypothetical protein [Propionibacteriaceae bacterium]